MAGYIGVLVSDPWLQNQFTQVELRSLKSHVSSFCFAILVEICFGFIHCCLCALCTIRAVHDDEERKRRSEAGRLGGKDVNTETYRRESYGAR